MQPPQLQSSIQVDKVIRFRATVGGASTITVSDLLDLICMATGSTAAFRVMQSVKLRAIRMWAPPGTGTISIQDLGSATGLAGPSRIVEDVALGNARPAHVEWRPARQSLQAMWQQGAQDLLEINYTVGTGGNETILDVHLSYIMQDGESPAAVGATVTGATTGQVYVRALDSLSSGNLVPVSYATI